MEYIIFEDRNPESPTFGAIRDGESGIQFATEMDADKKHWKWKEPKYRAKGTDTECDKCSSDYRLRHSCKIASSGIEIMACQIEHAKWRHESGQENTRQDMG